ncbi:ABC transporter ATP-binding protein [Paracoccus seriniphilus]|uniref:Carbohydrate ABC transporter ATP-binding protein, CUT1 family n=1 Tax=Paracoccus seriniphilus TaxID=184748 RepID=A0A239PYR6_9RHOB|nr:sn-glycerol-3-phosphate ABC transporter ATP-binding protein UgpC [Paracoccus seriniphilus]WCR16008.1 sn-glycerol-3-phosphate ABC transporter ATP-binding protein UgpC [Paracoccus seriniphilus]SNT75469.1 carbohydrate ABC transporter ATP-binding protein, CUT1 family [Paracoccus seriniphilus]
MTGVTLKNVIKKYGPVQVVHGVDLEIEDGEFCVFVGPSGCGKSTLLRMIAGLEETTDGAIQIGARDVTHADPAERGVAMVFQTYALYPHMTVEENMGFGLKMNGQPKDQVKAKVAEAARILQLEDYLTRKPKALSGGQRQRVAIGRAIVRGPEVFLFDEPLSNLDAELRVDMRVEISRLHKEIGATMIYVTHDQVEAMTLADKIVVLRAGSIEQVGSPMDLYQDPDNKFVAGFIGSPSMNFLDGVVQGNQIRIPALGDRMIAAPQLPATASGRVLVGLRPQHLRVSPGGSSLRLDLRERLGGVSYDYVNCLDGTRLVAESRNDESLPAGTAVGIDFDPADALYFDPETEQRLRPVTQPAMA